MTKKTKGIIALSCLSSLTIGLAIGLVAKQPQLSENGSFQLAKREKLAVISEDVSKAGNAVYIAISTNWDGTWNYSSNWETSAKFAVYFWDDSAHTGWSDFIVPANDYVGTDASNNRIFQGTVPSGSTAWTHMKAVRFNPDDENPGWNGEGHVYNEGTNHDITASKNQIKIASWSGSENWSTSAAERIAYWGAASSQWTSTGVCDNDGATDKDDLETSWAATALTYAAIKGADVKSYFSNLTAKEAKEGGNTAEDLAARYDHIREAHPTWTLDNFASR